MARQMWMEFCLADISERVASISPLSFDTLSFCPVILPNATHGPFFSADTLFSSSDKPFLSSASRFTTLTSRKVAQTTCFTALLVRKTLLTARFKLQTARYLRLKTCPTLLKLRPIAQNT